MYYYVLLCTYLRESKVLFERESNGDVLPQQSRTFGPTLARRWCPTKNNLGPTSGRWKFGKLSDVGYRRASDGRRSDVRPTFCLRFAYVHPRVFLPTSDGLPAKCRCFCTDKPTVLQQNTAKIMTASLLWSEDYPTVSGGPSRLLLCSAILPAPSPHSQPHSLLIVSSSHQNKQKRSTHKTSQS